MGFLESCQRFVLANKWKTIWRGRVNFGKAMQRVMNSFGSLSLKRDNPLKRAISQPAAVFQHFGNTFDMKYEIRFLRGA